MLEASCCVSNGVFVSVLWRLLLESSAWPRVSLRASAQCQGWSSPWARGPGSCSAQLEARCAGVPSCPRALLSSTITRSRPTSSTLSTCHPWATPWARMQLHWVFRMSPGKKLTTSCGTVSTNHVIGLYTLKIECISYRDYMYVFAKYQYVWWLGVWFILKSVRNDLVELWSRQCFLSLRFVSTFIREQTTQNRLQKLKYCTISTWTGW